MSKTCENISTGNSPWKLVSVVSKKNLEEVCHLLENSLADVNTSFKNILEDEQVDGPVLLLAIQNGHLEMLKMLVEKFGANVNQEVYLEEKLSTLLIFAMKCNDR